MKYILVLTVLFSLVLSGCTTTYKSISDVKVESYTFTKDRVDQEMQGNRGYLIGTPPPAPVERDVPKRTLIGVDVEIPVLPLEESRLKKDEPKLQEEAVYEEEVVMEEEETNYEPKPKPQATVVEENVAVEEKWVK